MIDVFGQKLLDTTLVINRKSLSLRTEEINDYQALFLSINGSRISLIDTIYPKGLSYCKYFDFDQDGYVDIMLAYRGNNTTYFLHLFDSVNGTFKKVEDFLRYPEALPLKKNNKYYYSYHRAGCADMNWVSDLFKIENYKAIQLGHIYGQSCEGEAPVINVYVVKDNDESKAVIVEKLPYFINIPSFGDKWDFIRKYWNKNFEKFAK